VERKTVFEIIAAVIGVVLAAAIGVRIKAYRNLVTYQITTIRHEVVCEDGRVVPYTPDMRTMPTRVFSFSVKIVNRGWKHLSDVRLHAEEDIHPFSIEKTASSISPATVTLGRRGTSLEIAIEFLPPKEELNVAFTSISRWADLDKFTGAGASYRVESIHYYEGYQGALNFVKTLFLYAVIVALGASIIGSVSLGGTAPSEGPLPNKQDA
jgi:hypothetical protein